jgi:hypothetical protein
VNAFGTADVRNAETWNTGESAEAVDLLLHGHERKKVIDALLCGQIRIVEWIVLKMPLIDLRHWLHALTLGRRRNDKQKSAKRNDKMQFHLDARSLSYR